MAEVLARLGRRIARLERARPGAPGAGGRDPDMPLAAWVARYLPDSFADEPSAFHLWLAGRLDRLRSDRGQRLNVLAPRGNAKTTWASFAYPLREALEGREQSVVIVSDTARQAKSFLRKIRRAVESNPAIRRDYGDARGEVWKEDHVEFGNGCEILALGTGGKIRGASTARSRRATLILADDVQNKDHIVSGLRRERSWEWLTKDLLSAGEPGTNVVVLGTALHRECIVCRLETTAGWRSRKWQSVVSWPARMDLWREWEALLHDYGRDDEERQALARRFYEGNRAEMDRGAEVLWPAREPLYALMEHRAAIGHTAFESEKQNNPIDASQCEWPEEYLDWPGMWFDSWDGKEWVVKTMALDPSKGRSDRQGDYSAIVLYGRDKAGVEYLEADVARRSVEAMCHGLVRLYQQFRPDGVGVETNQFQELLLIPLEHAARAAGVDTLPTHRVENYATPKEVRIRRLGAPLAQKRFRFKARSPGTMLLVQQLRDFPTGQYRDAPDAAEMARRLAIELFNKKAMGKR